MEKVIERDADLTNRMKNKCSKQSNQVVIFSSLSANYKAIMVGMFALVKMKQSVNCLSAN